MIEPALEDAARACRAAARAIRADADDRARIAMAAQANWEGPHRRSFDAALVAHQGRSASLEADALRAASQLEALAWSRR